MLKSIASLFGIVKDGPKAGFFPMQRRAKEETGEGGKFEPQSFAGVLQPIAAGKGEDDETPYQILMREVEEELGKPFAQILSQKNENDFFPLFEKEYIDKHEETVKNYNYFTVISNEDLGKIELHSGADPELVFLRKEDLGNIKTVKQMEGKEIGSSDLVMFPDQLSALRGAAEKIKK